MTELRDDDEMARATDLDAVFTHLRKQDDQIAEQRSEIMELRSDMAPAIVVIKNLEGFSNFCVKWGRRLHRFSVFAATVAAPIATVWLLLKEYFKAKGGQ